jgi:hypothetical protein
MSVVQNYSGMNYSVISPLQLPNFDRNAKRTTYAPPVRTSVDKIAPGGFMQRSFIQEASPLYRHNFSINPSQGTPIKRSSLLAKNPTNDSTRFKSYTKDPHSHGIMDATSKVECRTLETTIMDFDNK